jgi:hypothetical protein
VAAGLRLTASGGAELQVGAANGTALTLERGGDLTVDDASSTQRFTLRSGALRAHVARLLGGQRFIIDTGDAEVEVHGTTFRVAVVPANPRCGGGTETRVSVFEGVVTVRSAGGVARVPGGTEWPTNCAPPSARPAQRPSLRAERRRDGHVALAEPPPSAVLPAATPPRAQAPALPVVSPLSTENDLFAAAVRARRQGRAEEAAATWTRLIEAYPQGPLVESAMAQRMKALASVDPARAASAAREYLARFPSGFAREDAQRLSEPLPRDR